MSDEIKEGYLTVNHPNSDEYESFVTPSTPDPDPAIPDPQEPDDDDSDGGYEQVE